MNVNLRNALLPGSPTCRTTITSVFSCNHRVCSLPRRESHLHPLANPSRMSILQFAQVCSDLFPNRYYQGGLQSRTNRSCAAPRSTTELLPIFSVKVSRT